MTSRIKHSDPPDNIWSLPDNKKARAHYEGLKAYLRGLYPEGLSDREADEATRNLLGFSKLMLEITCEQAQAGDDE